jgi:SH3-like domain-containing protein
VLAFLFGGLLTLQLAEAQSRDEAIIVSATVTTKSSPVQQSVDAFVIHEGLKVRITDSVGDWFQIALADGKVGWIQATECERI